MDPAVFTLAGKVRAGHRNVVSRGARDGLTVEILPPGGAEAAMPELARVSRAWLSTRGMGEKGFSLGAFDPAWLAQQRIAVLRASGRVVAFVSLVATDLRDEVQVDLMRRLNDIPPAAMEFLFLRLMQEMQTEGFRWFGLGMAPLSGLSRSEAAPVWHRVGRLVYEHGERFYNFRGLRAFKQNFKPAWRSRYLATAPGPTAPLILLDAARLIGKGGPRA